MSRMSSKGRIGQVLAFSVLLLSLLVLVYCGGGEDEAGNLNMADFSSGDIYKIDIP